MGEIAELKHSLKNCNMTVLQYAGYIYQEWEPICVRRWSTEMCSWKYHRMKIWNNDDSVLRYSPDEQKATMSTDKMSNT